MKRIILSKGNNYGITHNHNKDKENYSIIPISEFKQICPSLDCGVVDYITTKKKIKDIMEDEFVYSLDEKTGKLKPAKVNALLDMGNKTVYELKTESGRAVNTTSNHPYLVKLYDKELCDKYSNTVWNINQKNSTLQELNFFADGYCTRWVEVSELKEGMEVGVPRIENQSAVVMPSLLSTKVVPSNLSGNLLIKLSNKDLTSDILKRCIRTTTIAGSCEGGNRDVFKKSLSNDNRTLCSLHASEYSFEFLIPFGAYFISIPLFERDLTNLASTSSSAKNLSLDINEPFTSQSLSSIMQGSLNVLFSQGWESFNNIFICSSSFKHFQDLPDHDSSAFESRLSMADFAVRDNEFINFSSHNINDGYVVFKSYDNSNKLGTWIEVSQLKEGYEIAVPKNDSEISPHSHLYREEKINQAHSLNKEPVRLTGISHEFKDIRSLMPVEYFSNDNQIDLINHNIYNNYLNFSLGRKNATDAHAGRAAVYQTAVSNDNRVQTQSNLNENPGGGAPTINQKNSPSQKVNFFAKDSNEISSDITFEKIISIKKLDKQQVYDLEIEGTHNFIANDIVAHNTNGDGNNSALPFVNTSGLVLLMHFNNESAFGENATGNSADRVYDFSVDANGERSSSTHNNGTTKSGATINKTDYKLGGGAGQFDGVNDLVRVSSFSQTTFSQLTVSVWVYSNNYKKYYAGVLNGGLLRHRLELRMDDTTAAPSFTVGSDDTAHFATSPDALSDGRWYHLVGTFDNSLPADNIKLFVNGINKASSIYTGNAVFSASSFDIGTIQNNLIYAWPGTIDELSIWNRTLSADEIKNLYKRGVLNLTMQVRSCDDNACSGESFTGNFGNSTLSNFTLAQNRFFQYKAVLETEDANLTPILTNVSVGFRNVSGRIVATLGELCDDVLQGPICVINTRHQVRNEILNYSGNILIQNGGSLFNETSISLAINLTGNLTIENGGLINLSGVSCTSGTCRGGGNLTILAKKVNVSGNIHLIGGKATGTSNQNKHGKGGNLILNSSQLFVYGTIDTSSHNSDNDITAYLGNDAGNIIINSSLVNVTGTLRANGGDGYPGCESGSWGNRGSGGSINITANDVYINGNVSAQRADWGTCNDGNGGSIIINATNVLTITNTSRAPPISTDGNVSGNILLIAKELYIDRVLNATNGSKTVSSDGSGANGTIQLQYNVTINISQATLLPAPILIKENEFGRLQFIDRISGYASLDLNKSINISNNLISVNSEGGALNKSANLTLNNVPDVSILRNGVACDATICTRLDYSNSQLIFNVTQFSTYSSASQNICDGGDLLTTCWINSTKYLNGSEKILSANNVILNGSAVLTNGSASLTSNLSYTFNLTGNLTLMEGSLINLTGMSCTSGTCSNGGNLTITANTVNVSGNVLLQGGLLFIAATCPSCAHGKGGNFILNASRIFVNGTVDSSSGNRDSSTHSFNGNDAGSIIINSSLVNITGIIWANGGDADIDSCLANTGNRGSGGSINITANDVYVSGNLSDVRADYGYCNNAQDGIVLINYTNSLDISSAVISRAPIISPFCDEGNLTDTCNLTRIHGLKVGEIVSANNLRIKSGNLGGDRFGLTYVINLTGNLTIENNTNLSANAPLDCDKPTGTQVTQCHPSGNISIIADIVNVTGIIIAQTLQREPSSNSRPFMGDGGIINISSNKLYVSGTIDASSDYVVGSVTQARGGHGGKIKINSTTIDISGRLFSVGGNGRNVCSVQFGGQRGNGGLINITADNITITGTVNASRGTIGLCNDGSGGFISITASNILNITNKIVAIGNVSGNISLNAKEIYLNTSAVLNATNGTFTVLPDGSGVNGTIKLQYNLTINISTAQISPAPFLTKENEYGKIQFIDRISGYASLDLNKSINISNNLISVNSEGGALNKSANLTIKGIANDTILREGIACPAAICAWLENGSSAGALFVTFNVTQFTNYSVGNTLPTITIVNASDKTYRANQTINWTSNDLDNDLLTFFVFFEAKNPPSVLAATTLDYNFTTNMTNDTVYFLNVTVSDGTVNVSSAIWNITLDTSTPLMSGMPANGTAYNKDINITITAEDNNLFELNCSVYNISNNAQALVYSLNYTNISTTTRNINASMNASWGDGNKNLSCWAGDTRNKDAPMFKEIKSGKDKFDKAKNKNNVYVFNDTETGMQLNITLLYNKTSGNSRAEPLDDNDNPEVNSSLIGNNFFKLTIAYDAPKNNPTTILNFTSNQPIIYVADQFSTHLLIGSGKRRLSYDSDDAKSKFNVSIKQGSESFIVSFAPKSNINKNDRVTIDPRVDNLNIVEQSAIVIIDTIAPNITLLSPLNNTGDIDGNLTFFFNVSDTTNVTNCTFFVNNAFNISDTSITREISQNFTLSNIGVGAYNYSINCTDSANNTANSAFRSFVELQAARFNGTTIDFTTVDIRNITNLTIEDTVAGKINFTQSIDLSDGADLGRYVNISFNKIEVNSSSVPALNRSATLKLYGLTFSNPRILRDGSVCPSDICAEISYSGGNFTFNVTNFTAYSSEETPVEAETTGTSVGAGSPGGGIKPEERLIPKSEGIKKSEEIIGFELSKSEIKEKLLVGAGKKVRFEVTNTGTVDLSTSINVKGTDIAVIEKDSFELEIGASKTVTLSIIAEKAGIFTGKIIVKAGNIEKSIPIVIEVVTENALFDIKLAVPPKYRVLKAGDYLIAQISLFEAGKTGKIDATVNYIIKDTENNIVMQESETFAIDEKKQFTKKFKLPENIMPGKYVIAAEIIYDGGVAVSSALFEVIKEEKSSEKISKAAVEMLVLILILLGLIYLFVMPMLTWKIKKVKSLKK